jgi:2-oxoglutarate ferredoxin oxidoreductase subunit beta
MAVKDYIRQRFFPHLWCAGCGHGIVLNGLIRAVEKLGMSRNEMVMVSGIGCSSRISGYMDFHTLHTIHGRALAFATGVKLSKPELNVIVPMGDGDALSIGGNHFIHAARRNIDITAIVMNNRIYGMTGGQYSPLTGPGIMATTAPFSNIDQGFDVVEMARAAGATFVARTTTYHVQQMADIIRAAILARRLFGGGGDEPVPDLLRPQEQAGRGRGDDEAHEGGHHAHRIEGQGREPGADRAGDLRAGGKARVLQRV